MVWHGCNETNFGLRPAAPDRGRDSEKRIRKDLTKEAILWPPARYDTRLARGSTVAESKVSVWEDRAHGAAELEGMSGLSVRMEAAMKELGERAAAAAELASSINRRGLDVA